MRLRFLSLTLLILLIGSQNNAQGQHDEGRKHFTKDQVNKMFKHVNSLRVHKQVFTVEFTSGELIKFLNESPDKKVTFFVAYDTIDHLPNIIAQTTDGTAIRALAASAGKRKKHYFPSYNYYQGKLTCPPPPGGCSLR